jgi:hypothetical protein
MKKYLLLAALTFCLFVPSASAHTLAVDGEIGVTLHVHPDDEPIANRETPFYIDIAQRGQSFSLINCQCSLAILQNNKLLVTLPVKYLQSPIYVFPAAGTYEVKISGKPLGAAQFSPFTTEFTYYVRSNTDLISTTQSVNTLQVIFPYVTLAVSIAIMCILLIPLNFNRKGKQ